MLVLSRRVGEEIVIANGIQLRVLKVRGGMVRLGIAAPDTVAVLRHELHGRLTSESAASECQGTRDDL